MTYTFTQSLQAFKTEVNIKHPLGAIHTRRVQGITKGRGGRGTGRDSGRYAGRGRFGRGRGGRGYGGGSYSRTGSKVITLKNGKKIDYHAFINSKMTSTTTRQTIK